TAIQNRFYKATDAGPTTVWSLFAMAGGNQTFKGLSFAPISDSPAIASNPSSVTNNEGTIATFSVTGTGTGQLLYQWRKNGTDLSNGGNVSGATSSSLTLSGIAFADAASYTVVVTGFGSVTSAPNAVLTVN